MWVPDDFLEGFEKLSWPIEGAQFADGEPTDNPLTATLVRRNAPSQDRAVLYIHGWDDYFFQSHMADFWAEQGFDFYAIDLRRYGRNLTPGLFAGYITDLHDYFTEIDDAYVRIQDEGHSKITLMGHSTGGLIASLWASEAPHLLNGLILNSPWLDMAGTDMLWSALSPLVSSVAFLQPTTSLQITDYGIYRRTLQETGDWGIDPNYKSNEAFVVRFGWGKAILAGHKAVSEGLNIDTPVLSMMSTKSMSQTKEWDPEFLHADTVLDVDNLARASINLGQLVTICRIQDGIHDLVLSTLPVREKVFSHMKHWAKAYL
ncbi:alpha/beta hydrolase [Propionimicrobium lymphophilum]|uniref:Serine aminopeptidase S33 domain-containing protein n=1 Tax=Propionimicrobium lymphophilum ACS-093-V-SCH5 TaxID=883161 RepID=S2WIK1_9ACTN|nr:MULTISPECIES: alpha/beta hydrolase [Propionimicrobium]EPD32467.1 hypothetical protein HMPREF9306_02039 [Propionimicrobium lymphophilum ACS-093-V-SCH5]ETJ97065.1 alpha/beta hydrolase family protein [Propionimicrobium sp. BV2F7]MDK7710697.1 alpha/beta hydrolase [Propionimicrobium lymphophilum]MDK7734350.1 alpha/beta hydrolase [Propionimicrobium lymphophilum]